METCFSCSRASFKSLDLHPTTCQRSFFISKRIKPQSHITRCHLSSSSSPEEDSRPIIQSDWRSFRARMVANEMAIRFALPDHEPEATHPARVTIGDKWVHTIQEPEKGCLLIATEKLDGVHIFERTVILLLSSYPTGPFGIILNRPSLMSIKEMRSSLIDESGTFSDKPLYFGGPMEEGLFLVKPQGGYDVDRVGKSGVFEEVMPGLFYGTKESAGCAAEIVKRNLVRSSDFRFYDGYCVWDREQLREEIDGGYWTLAACSPSAVGLSGVSVHGLWEDVNGLMRPKSIW